MAGIYSERLALKIQSGTDSGSILYTATAKVVLKRISGSWNSAHSSDFFGLYMKAGGAGPAPWVYVLLGTGATNQPFNDELRVVLDSGDVLYQYHGPSYASIDYQISGFRFTT